MDQESTPDPATPDRDEHRAERLAALDRYDVLDTPREPGFDDVAALASEICGTPIALVSFLAGERQWFKAEVGAGGVTETPVEASFCRYTLIEAGDLLVVPDATRDPRFAANPAVTGAPGVRFYAGAVLRTEEGVPIGTVCVLDTRARALSDQQRDALRRLARQVMAQLELRRALHEQRATHARLNAILDSAKDYAVITAGRDAAITSWSAGAEAIFGWSAAEAVGEPASIIFTPEDRAAGVDARELATAAREGCAADERWHLRKDGGRVFLNGSLRTLSGSPGEANGFVKIARDETERRRGDERRQALAELADRIRDMESPADLAYAAAELLGRTLGVSRAGYGTIDLAAETVTIARDRAEPGLASLAGLHRLREYGSYVDDLKRGETVVIADVEADPRTAGTAAALLALGVRSAVNMPLTENGVLVAVLFLAHHAPRLWVPDELAFVRDVAGRTRTAVERRRAERELRELAASLERQVAERTAERDRVWLNSRDLLVVVGADGVFRAINPAWEAILGHHPSEVVGRSFLEFIWPEDAVPTQGALDEAAAQRDQTSFENRYRHRDGTPRWISWHSATEGDLVYAYGRDITGEKERIDALRRSEEALRQAQKMEAVGQLTGGVAHDFNNLLTIIKSSTDLLRRPNLAEERRRRYVDAIAETVDRASKLTGQLLAFARRQALRPEVFDAAERIRAVTDMLRTIVGARVPITADLACEPCWVRADASQFETALVNMAVNARDAMGGEGRLTIHLDEVAAMPPIRGHGGGPGPFVSVSLTDTGSGIPPDRLVHIFEPFFTTKPVGQGTGLGLSQVFGFAKQSGGDVAVESTVGEGTTFTLYLPRVEAPAGEDEEADAPGPAEHGRGRRVLVVEDNVEVGRFSTQILQDLGYKVTWAANADEALTLLSEVNGFDVVFSDVVMPGMNGIELGREIRRRHPGLPVVLTSGYSHVLAEEGTHGFELVHKPYAAEELSRVLRRATRRRRGPGRA